ncbi:MAG TPA: DUF6335 family protein [Candidatus Limnocylindria bacterium]|nr:DUF6335 family protein [Candidatus Limnocylindria bacterium]
MSKRKPKPTRSRRKATKKETKKTIAKKKSRASPARRANSRGRKRTTATRRGRAGAEDQGRMVGLLREVIEHHETGPAVSAGDLDADWQRAQSSGEEAVGGSAPTPDQDVVDEIGHALGVEQPSTAPLRTSEEILKDRDRRYWELDRRAQQKATKRREP